MDYREVVSRPPYDRLVHCVWFLTGRSGEYRPQPVVPDGRLELLVHRADPFSSIHSDGSTRPQDTVLVAGQLTGPIHLQPGSMIDVIGIRLTPLGAHAVLDLPLNALTNSVVALRDVRPRLASLFLTEAHRRGSHQDRAGAMTKLLGRSMLTDIDPLMEHADQLLSSGRSIDALSHRPGITIRTLQRRFQRDVGVAPKVYQRVVRFRRAFSLLQQEQNGARVAAVSGYYDQAHMIRDFTQFAGAAPTSFFRSDPALAQAFSTANHDDTKFTKNS